MTEKTEFKLSNETLAIVGELSRIARAEQHATMVAQSDRRYISDQWGSIINGHMIIGFAMLANIVAVFLGVAKVVPMHVIIVSVPGVIACIAGYFCAWMLPTVPRFTNNDRILRLCIVAFVVIAWLCLLAMVLRAW